MQYYPAIIDEIVSESELVSGLAETPNKKAQISKIVSLAEEWGMRVDGETVRQRMEFHQRAPGKRSSIDSILDGLTSDGGPDDLLLNP